MNSLEDRIIRGARKAQEKYLKMTGGYWIWHGPESFLQTVVATELAHDHWVYVDTSTKRVRVDMKRGPGRPTDDLRKRLDISIWNKSDNRLRAIIEIKRSWTVAPVKKDAVKIEKYLKSKQRPRAGYILAYSEAKKNGQLDRVEFLEQRFAKWQKALAWKRIHSIFGTKGDDEWAWGFCLFRCP